MNKLQQYKDDKAVKFNDDRGGFMGDVIEGFIGGFDAAIALDLPVKFSLWKDRIFSSLPLWTKVMEDMKLKNEDGYFKSPPSREKLYQYWIDNIYKPE